MLSVPAAAGKHISSQGHRSTDSSAVMRYGSLCSFSRSFAESCGDCHFPPAKMTNKYCGDLRRRRICAKAEQKNIKILAREIPSCGALETLGLRATVPGLNSSAKSAPLKIHWKTPLKSSGRMTILLESAAENSSAIANDSLRKSPQFFCKTSQKLRREISKSRIAKSPGPCPPDLWSWNWLHSGALARTCPSTHPSFGNRL